MADTYVLVHGAWHTGALMEPVAAHLRAMGHQVHCPTLAGNRPGDDRSKLGLADACQSLVDFLVDQNLSQVRLVGHSYGGMVISKAADAEPARIKRLIYHNAFVPLNGECLNDMVPSHYIGMFDAMNAADPHNLALPPPVWREAFINDADEDMAMSAYAKLNPQPYKTFTDKIVLNTELAAMPMGKSYINFRQDTALPHSLPWHPRLSEKLGLFRLVEGQGSHEVCFSNPKLLAEKIVEAGRD